MKYLKTFEKTKYNLKKYFIIKSSIGYILLENVKFTDNKERIVINQLYILRTKGNEIKKMCDYYYNFTLKYIIERIIYQSNNIDDCLEFLEVLLSQNKYNL